MAIDTTDDPELEAKWQALVAGVITAKADAEARRGDWHAACVARGSLSTATDEGIAAAEAARLAYLAAKTAVEVAGARMKDGDL